MQGRTEGLVGELCRAICITARNAQSGTFGKFPPMKIDCESFVVDRSRGVGRRLATCWIGDATYDHGRMGFGAAQLLITDSGMNLLLLLQAHVGATLFMVGLIWFVQIVHYPLLAGIGPSESVAFQRDHMHFTSLVVAGPMLVELGTAVALVWLSGGSLAWSGLALLAVIWGTTGLVLVPAHKRLLEGFDQATHRRLVRWNWVRTPAWTGRGVLALAWLQG